MRHTRFVFVALVVALLVSLQPVGAGQATQRPQPPPAPEDVAAPPADALKSETGLYSKVVKTGTGDTHPGPADTVTVRYSGWTTQGRCFDSSLLRENRPSTFVLNGVLPGWSEGVQLMVVGETRRLWVPEALAFKGAEGKPKGMVVFDIELLDIKVSPLTAPPDVASPPKDAKRTSSGLTYRVLREGDGGRRPSQWSQVTVHYTGWTTDGQMFDSSVQRGEPATFSLDAVIRGWTEGVQLMTVGEKTRFWIPQDLAYQGKPGMPRGMLVFDVELIGIEK